MAPHRFSHTYLGVGLQIYVFNIINESWPTHGSCCCMDQYLVLSFVCIFKWVAQLSPVLLESPLKHHVN